MLAAKLKKEIGPNGQVIFSIDGPFIEINREDFKKEEEELQRYKDFLSKVSKVDIRKLNKPFTI